MFAWSVWLKMYICNRLWLVDLYLWRYYSFGRAYGVSLRNRPEKRRIGLTYGETPARVFFSMISWLEIPDGFVFWELGSGTGRLSLMLAKLRKSKTIAVDCITPFVNNANQIAKRLSLDGFLSLEKDIFSCSWSEADVIYITATAFSEEQVLSFQQKSLELKDGAFLFSLSHMPSKEGFVLIKMDVIKTSWGESTVYLSQRRAKKSNTDEARLLKP